MKDVDETLDEAQVVADDTKDMELPEAPTSMTMRVWIKGYGVMLTVRDNKMSSLLKKTETMVDYAISHSWKNVWDKPLDTPIEKKIKEKVSQEECHHANIGQKKSSGYNKPENKGRMYEYCTNCNKFLQWVE